MPNFDVVIIGAGLAGLQCAKLLSRSGAKVLLVDRKHDLTKGIHTTGIFVRKTLEDFDFPAGTLGNPVRNVTLYSPKLRALSLESEKDEFRVGKMGELYKSILRECTANGVEFAKGTRYIKARICSQLTGAQASRLHGRGSAPSALRRRAISTARGFFALHAHASGPLALQSKSVIVRLERNGEAFEVETKVLVGADGARSRVAKDLKLDENEEWIVGYEEVFHNVPLYGQAVLHCFLDAEIAPGYLAWITNDGDQVHIGVGGYPAKFDPREAINKFREKIAPRFVDLSSAELVETRGGSIPVGGILKRIANENGLLIGDAAGAVSPLTAGGLDPCLRLSAMAARIIEERLRTGDPTVMLRFSGELFRARFISRLWMRRIISIFTNQTVLELGCALLRNSFGKRLAKHVFFGRGSFPNVDLIELNEAKLTSPPAQ